MCENIFLQLSWTENKTILTYFNIHGFEVFSASVHFVVFDLLPEILVDFACFRYLSEPVAAPFSMSLVTRNSQLKNSCSLRSSAQSAAKDGAVDPSHHL